MFDNFGKNWKYLIMMAKLVKILQNYVYDLKDVSTSPSFQVSNPPIKGALSSSLSPFHLQAHYGQGALRQFDNPYL
jgi:hypothetical protein